PSPQTPDLTHDHFQELDRNQDGMIDPVERAFGRIDMDRDLHTRTLQYPSLVFIPPVFFSCSHCLRMFYCEGTQSSSFTQVILIGADSCDWSPHDTRATAH